MLCDKRQCSWPRGSTTSLYHKRPVFALSEPMVGRRDSATTGGLSGTVALARSIVTRSAPCLCRCMGSRTPCCATTAALLVGVGLWSSCVRLRCQDLLRCRAISISTGRALVIRHPLQPLSRVTLRTGMQRCMVHRDQMGCRRRCVIRCHRSEEPPLGTPWASACVPGTRVCLGR